MSKIFKVATNREDIVGRRNRPRLATVSLHTDDQLGERPRPVDRPNVSRRRWPVVSTKRHGTTLSLTDDVDDRTSRYHAAADWWRRWPSITGPRCRWLMASMTERHWPMVSMTTCWWPVVSMTIGVDDQWCRWPMASMTAGVDDYVLLYHAVAAMTSCGGGRRWWRTMMDGDDHWCLLSLMPIA